ncbi:MAG: glycosyltransferase family 39 protein [Deltaproteobacteria bacterium]|nr:glycosyltransferase family 39 protein [Deltaproteobacteria bacterium]
MMPQDSPQSPIRRALASLGSWTGLLWGLLVLLWLLDVTSGARGGIYATLGRFTFPLVGVVTLVWVGSQLRRHLRSSPTQLRWLLPGLLALSFAIRLVGVDHEVFERAYRDEGTYYHHADKINQGEWKRFSFVYPHFLYYLDGFSLWLAGLFPEIWHGLALNLFGVEEHLARSWLILRFVAALISALVVLPVFRIAEALGGALAGAFGALLVIFSRLFNDGSHLFIADVPSAVFATFSLWFSARLLTQERRRDYLLAGMFAGLAAATKYPAGLVAVAIIAAWVKGRLESRRFSFDLIWAGLISLATFVACMPTFLLYPRIALFGDRGMLFGVRQYAKGGWIGVMPESNWQYYGGELAASFGLVALILGIAGLFLLGRSRGWRLLWLLAFPAAYLLLVGSMNMVVRRNLFPALPSLAAVLGIGLGVLVYSLARLRPPWSTAAAATLGLAALAQPVSWASLDTLALARPSTRDVASQWISENLPPGSGIIKESYTPRLDRNRFALRQSRFAARIPLEEIRRPHHDFLLLARPAYQRFLDGKELTKEHHHEFGRRYREILADFPKVKEFAPGLGRRGAWLELYQIPPLPGAHGEEGSIPASVAFLSHGSMRPEGSATVHYAATGQWSLFKALLEEGDFLVRLQGEVPPGGALRVLDLDRREITQRTLGQDTEAVITLPRQDKYLFYLDLPPGSSLSSFEVSRFEITESESPELEGTALEGTALEKTPAPRPL